MNNSPGPIKNKPNFLQGLIRNDGKTFKGRGFYGPLLSTHGNNMTEYSVGVNIDGQEIDIPTLIPGLSFEELNYLKSEPNFDNSLGKQIIQKAVDFANQRKSNNQPYFATFEEEGKTQIPQDMKNKKTIKKDLKDLFAFGGVAMNVATPSEEVAKAQRVSQQAHFGAMSDSTVAGLRGIGNMMISTGMSMASKGMSQNGDMSGIGGFLQDNMGTINSLVGAGQSASYYHAAGGVVNNKNINAEGGEVIETPGGQPQELQGASHEQGGINMQVPSGTEIYSDRLIGADGKTMAERKKLRENQISKIEKLLQKNPNDSALKKTLEKTKQNNDFLDKQDLSQMQFVKDLVDHTNKFAFGGITGPGDDEDEYGDLINKYPVYTKGINKQFDIWGDDELKPLKTKSMDVILPDTSFSITPEMDARIGTTTNTQQKGFSLDNYLGGTTLGDMIGMGANLFGPMAQMKNTLANRNATPLEQNFYKNYGDQALKKIQSQYGLLDDVRDNQLQNAELSRQGTIARNNNSARGINTQRALNLATDSSMNELKANIFNQYAQQAMGITAQEATQMAQNDQMRMQGEDRRAERELQNTDNFFSNMAKNISDKYRGIGETGKALNETKQRETTNEILKDMNPNYEYDPYTGKLITKKTETLETEKAKDADIKRQGAVKGTNLENIYTEDGKVDETKITDAMWKNKFPSKEEAVKFYTEHKDDKYRDAALPKEIDTEYKRWKDPNGEVFKTKEDYDNANKYGHKLELNTIVKGNKHLSTKNYTSADVTNLQSVMKKLNIDTLDLDNQDSIKTLQKALGMKSSDIAAGKFGQKTLLAIKKYLEKNK